ncbi:CHAT domain-containing protein [Acrocarpospora catenulata]|uniref:CHAT domain-containing protein n=1 Tax=Acrocarpospora catenulata TaxID=2836182 RepID=UPI001BD9CD6E|nr:CHAT domain-containing protein [Acrocarpospora catenulata]
MDFFSPAYGGPAGKSPGGSPELLLAQAEAAVLAGDQGAALALLDRVGWLVPHGSALLVRCLAWTRLARVGRYGLWPDGCGPIAPEIEAREPWLETAAMDETRLELAYQAARDSGNVDLGLDLQAGVTLRIMAELPHAQSALRAAAGTGLSPAELDEQLVFLTSDLAALHRALGQIPAAAPVTALVSRAMATLHREAGLDETAADLLTDAEQRCAADPHGYAQSQIMRGDWAAAVRTSPLLLDHWPVLSLGPDTDRTGTRVFPGRRVHPAAAAAAYDRAELVLTGSGVTARRLRAGLRLRRSFLARLAGRDDEAVTLAAEAVELAVAAGDRQLRWTAWVHLALATIATDTPFDPQGQTARLAAWAHGPGSLSVAEGLGALCSQEGHHAAATGHYARAEACHLLARQIHAALGYPGNEAQCAADLGTLRLRIGDQAGARAAFEQAATLLEAGIRRRPEPDLRESIRLVAILLLDLHPLDVRRADPDGLRRTADRIRAAMAGLPAFGDDNALATLDPAADPSDLAAPDLPELLAAWVLGRKAGHVLEITDVQAPTFRARAALARGEAGRAEELFDEAMAAADRADPEWRDVHRATVLGGRRERAQAAAVYRAHVTRARARGGTGPEEHETAALAFTTFHAHTDAEQELQALRGRLGEDWWRRSPEPWNALEIEAETARGLAAGPRRKGPGIGFGRAVAFYREALRALNVVRDAQAGKGVRREGSVRRAQPDPHTVARIRFGAARCLLQAAAAVRIEDAARSRALAEEAFLVAERSRARSFLTLLETRRATGEPEVRELALWRTATAEVALCQHLSTARQVAGEPPDSRLERRLAEAEAELARLEKELAGERPALWRALDARAEPIGVAEAARLLPPGALLVAYLLREDELLVWAIDRTGLRECHSLTATGVEGLVQRVRQACAGGGHPGRPAAALAELLLTPVHGSLLTADRVLLVPSGALHSLPFAALPWRGAPLAAQRTLSVLPDASALASLRPVLPEHLAAGRLLAVGDPVFMRSPGGAGLPVRHARRLPASGLEVDAVAAAFPGQARVLLGAEATREAVLREAREATVVHLATHAWLNEASPLSSAVLLSDGQSLSVADLAGATLDADLVVFSACRTGQGGLAQGEDVRGLLRGVLAAGAGAAVVALWPVHDLATAVFMADFHRRLRRCGSVPEALRRTQEVFRRRSRAQHERAVLRLLGRGTASAEGERLRGARAALAAKDSDYWNWLDSAGHPGTWAAFTAVASPH